MMTNTPAIRSLRRSPGFTLACVSMLAVGIGSATAILTVLESVLVEPLPVRDQQAVVALRAHPQADGVAHVPLRASQFLRLQARAQILQDVAGVDYHAGWPRAFRAGDRVLSLKTGFVTGNFFQMLGVAPVIGRLLQPDDDVPGAQPVMVISHGLWRDAFGTDPDIVGRRLTLHDRRMDYTIIGVAPAGFDYPVGVDFWAPIIAVSTPPGSDSSFAFIDVVGRLAGGVGPSQARDEYQAFLFDEPSLARLGSIGVSVQPLSEAITGDVRPILLLIVVAAALLLLIASVNVANLLMVRLASRVRELAVRHALGASRLQILRQLVTEGVLLTLVSGAVGLGLAAAFLRIIAAVAPADLPRADAIVLDSGSLIIWAIVTVTPLLVFGIAPAWWAVKRSSAAELRAGSRGATETRGSRLIKDLLVAWQVALAVAVLAAAGLLTRSLLRLQTLDMGYGTERLAIAEFAWSWEEFGPRALDFYDQLIPRVQALPGVRSATPVLLPPFSGTGGWDGRFVAEGQSEVEAGSNPWINMEIAGPAYLQTLDLPLLSGRPLTAADREGAAKVVLVSAATASRLWPGLTPVGKRVRLQVDSGPDAWWTVVGVVRDTRYRALRTAGPSIYFPYRQFNRGLPVALAIRTERDPGGALASLRRVVQETDPAVIVWRATTMNELLSVPLARPRTGALLLAGFALAALLLAALGIYGVLAFTVRQRARELAIRHALGASQGTLRALVIRRGMAVTVAGVVLGLAAALAAGQVTRAVLFEVSPADPVTLIGVTGLLIVVALLASYLPAHRASRVDPATVLQAD